MKKINKKVTALYCSVEYYSAFQLHANSEVQQIYAAVNHYRNGRLIAETNKVDRNPPITSQEREPAKLSPFLRGPDD